MMEIMWIFVMVVFCTEAWSINPGTNENTPVNFTASSSSTIKLYVNRYENYKVESEVNLTCSNKTWTETMYVIWKIQMKNKNCTISFDSEGRSENTCGDGKSLRNTSAQSYLHISKLSADDEGVFMCESVYTGGNDNFKIHVNITVPPSIHAWFERKDNKMVAVCEVVGVNPASNISWSYAGSTLNANETSLCTKMQCSSRLELPEGMAAENLSCSVRHPFWEQEKILKPELKKGQASAHWTGKTSYSFWLWILIAAAGFAVLAGVVLFAQKIMMLRQSQQSDSLSKFAKTEDVEDVEPYASYVQRVNSIYNT
ncbi:cell surface glycoprotein CD200 receptor 1 isoform X2 [Mugil cephalus]|uniref:cell surface glycoprotein CD200 receptor 1 isoform X2 n=1 Tax=Mugil cephalus TaxID=48193 RepID=UPI001FB85EA3|nr:cell surface glycoprotein CD200 receptor 1 isoform X2 [Mugil cephalus]